ncbi:uncharacterized protein BXZ73DRAFT_20271, partial [Epithele typhae]|uniref:uncharacterized protein n=1 Tax=Epithele typhae TaxID=378194 RepID=UPI0020081526
MVSGVNPANLSKARRTRGTTAQNPIVVEDEPMRQPFIGRHPTKAGSLDPSSLPRPTSEQILGSLLQQKNVLPVIISLLRLLSPGALAGTPSPPSSTPSYTPPGPPPQGSFFRSAPFQGYYPPANVQAPPVKRRKLNNVPAGATDWDVPYPFQEGQGPDNYRTNWERERGKQVLGDLVHLVQSAAQKAAAKDWLQQQQARRPG